MSTKRGWLWQPDHRAPSNFGTNFAFTLVMKPQKLLMLALTLTALVVASGCDRAVTFKTKLDENEKVAMKSPVFIDDTEAGYVEELKVEAGERVAVLALTDKQVAKERIRSGVFRVVGEVGRIVLRTDGVKADAAHLPAGTFIPSKSKTQYAVERFTGRGTLALVVIAVAVVLLIVILLKSAAHYLVLLLALGLATVSAWALHPYLVPQIQTLYQSMPVKSQTQAQTGNGTSGTEPNFRSPIIEDNFANALGRRPDPRVLAFAASFTFGLLFYAVLLSRAVRALKRNES